MDNVPLMMALPFYNGLASFSEAGDHCSVSLVGEGFSVRGSGVSSGKGSCQTSSGSSSRRRNSPQ